MGCLGGRETAPAGHRGTKFKGYPNLNQDLYYPGANLEWLFCLMADRTQVLGRQASGPHHHYHGNIIKKTQERRHVTARQCGLGLQCGLERYCSDLKWQRFFTIFFLNVVLKHPFWDQRDGSVT